MIRPYLETMRIKANAAALGLLGAGQDHYSQDVPELWHRRVRTLNSCCGHGRYSAWVIVEESSNDLMESHGYSYYIAPSGMNAYLLGRLPVKHSSEAPNG